MKQIAVVMVMLGLLLLAAPSGLAQDFGAKGGDVVISPDSVAYGRTYSDWQAAWNQWSFSLPVDKHPLFTDGDCSVGQSGPVWFLGGNFVPPSTRVRYCNIPFGTALFFPVVDWEDSALEESLVENPGNPAFQQIAGLRSFLWSAIATAAPVYCEIDHKRIPQFESKFRVQSGVFEFTLPANNLLTAVYGTTFDPGTYFPAVDDGWYVMLAPLSPGNHVIHFGSAFNDITYYITVTK